MTIENEMKIVWAEMEKLKNEREELFTDLEANKSRIANLHYEIEIKKLQYMIVKRGQLVAVNDASERVAQSAADVAEINETCIGILQKTLAEHGFSERLKQEGLI